MNYRIILFSLFFFIAFFCSSQNESIDLEIKEYRNQISNTTIDSVKIRLYTSMANRYNKIGQFEEAVKTQKSALSIARKNNLTNSIINSLKLITYYNSSSGNYNEGFLAVNEAIKLAKITDYQKLEELYLEKSWLHIIVGEYDSLEISANKMLALSNDYYIVVCANTFLGDAYTSQHRFKEAMEKFILVRDIVTEKNDVRRIGVTLSNIALIHFEIQHYDKALSTIEEAMKMGVDNNNQSLISFCLKLKAQVFIEQKKYKEAESYLEQAREISVEKEFFELTTEIGELQGNLYRLQKRYDLSIKKYKEVIEFEKNMNSNLKQSLVFTNLAQVFYDLKMPDSSLYYLDLAKKATIKSNSKQLYIELLSKIYADKKDFEKAYLHYKDYVVIRDSIDSIARKNEAYALEADYQFRQKEDEIEILNTKNKLQKSQLYALVGFVGLALLILLYIYSRFKAKARINKQLTALDKTKTQFFTNISHEFRTPLSLMLGPIQAVLKNNTCQSDKDNLSLAYKNGKRLHHMINQLLDLSKIESNSMPLEVEKTNISRFICIVFSYFTSMADDKEIEYRLDIEEAKGEGYLDKDKVEKILINLLSNAFKFTPNHGSIKLKAQVKYKKLLVKVIDNGVGIPKDKTDEIFRRFYQIDNSHTRMAEGSGIGLALSKELSKRHLGDLTVSSRKEQGSEFILEIPINKESYSKANIRLTNSSGVKMEPLDIEFTEEKLLETTGVSKSDKPLLLIVEDNIDMLNFIMSMLKEKYNIMIASNGKEAYSKALEKIPSIIISDYMMPVMDGMIFSKMIREHEATSHIPIVMLTAKNEQSTRLRSLETGVSSFLTKPFNIDELLLVIDNLMDQQNKMKKLYRGTSNSILTIKDISLPASEKSFLERMMTLFEKKYGDINFGIEQLSDELCLSRVQVYRKIKAITGESPGDLLRIFRLEKAKILLKKSSSNVGEISEKVGFGNQSNFSKNFKKYTGISPSDYINKLHN